ncbi:P-loop containing nucleoside triphosphate hydrolase protein [Chiua virens]|nr:P-loop containing nucleoside triphosphate hydrolase protein [Chiua virens]
MAQDRVDGVKREIEQERHRACARLEEADGAAARAAEEVERWRAQLGKELAEAASRVAQEVAARPAGQSQEHLALSQGIKLDVEKSLAAAREDAEKAQKAADEQRIAAEIAAALGQEIVRTAAEEARKASEAKAEAERRLKEGIQPVVTPTLEELTAAKKRIQYEEGRCHIAIVGISGSGKSSLVNAFRGLHGRDPRAAAAGVTETTLHLTRYADTNSDYPFVWYDTPGAGTLKCPDWQYFNDQGLYVFDSIIVLSEKRLTLTDIAILMNARRFNIPTYIVRSKADQHIRNVMMMDMGYDSERDGEEDAERRNQLYKAAKKQFIEKTRENVKSNLEVANLPNQRVYIVSSNTLLHAVLNEMPNNAIDEVDLLNNLLGEIHRRQKADVVG